MQGIRKRNAIIVAIILPLTCYIFFSFTGKMYGYSDNLMVAAVSAGMYGENNFCQYLHPALCLIIKFLNPLFPTVDIFTAIVHMSILCGAMMLTYIGVKTLEDKPFKSRNAYDFIKTGLLLLAVAYCFLGLNLFGENYTVQTAVIIFCGMTALFYGKEKKKWLVIAATVLMTIGFMIRLESSLLFVPYIALDVITELLRANEGKEHFKAIPKTILPSLVIVAVLLFSKFAFNSVEPYSSDARYNKYRTIAEDYWMKGWDGYDSKFEAIDKSTYYAAIDWILIDTDRLDADMLEKITKAGNITSYEKSAEGIGYAFKAMYRRIRYSNLHLLLLTLITLLLLTRNVIFMKSWWLKLESLFSVLGGFLILFYFTFMGRAPLRVWLCVLFATLSILIMAMAREENGRKRPEAVFQLLLCVILYFGIGQAIAYAQYHPFQTAFTAKIRSDDSSYDKTFNENALYIWPHWYDQIPEHFAKQNKLPTQRVIDHNIAMGDWTYGQTYYTDFLKRINVPNPALALLERPDTYFVEGLNDEFLKYMQDHYGDSIQIEYVHDVNGKKAYRLVRGSITGNTDGVSVEDIDTENVNTENMIMEDMNSYSFIDSGE